MCSRALMLNLVPDLLGVLLGHFRVVRDMGQVWKRELLVARACSCCAFGSVLAVDQRSVSPYSVPLKVFCDKRIAFFVIIFVLFIYPVINMIFSLYIG